MFNIKSNNKVIIHLVLVGDDRRVSHVIIIKRHLKYSYLTPSILSLSMLEPAL